MPDRLNSPFVSLLKVVRLVQPEKQVWGISGILSAGQVTEVRFVQLLKAVPMVNPSSLPVPGVIPVQLDRSTEVMPVQPENAPSERVYVFSVGKVTDVMPEQPAKAPFPTRLQLERSIEVMPVQ